MTQPEAVALTKWFIRAWVAGALLWTVAMRLAFGPEATISRVFWTWEQAHPGFAWGAALIGLWLLLHFFGSPLKWS